MIDLLHLSDIHFHRKSDKPNDVDKDLRAELERDVELVVEHLGKPFDAILVSGDIAYSGGSEEYAAASAWLKQLCEIAQCGASEVWVCPGNHDVHRPSADTPVCRAVDELVRTSEPTQAGAQLAHILQTRQTEMLFAPLKEYNKFAQQFGCRTETDQVAWKHSIPIKDGLDLTLCGLNSVLLSRGDDDKKRLVVGETQLPSRRSGSVFLTICHHPPEWLLDEERIDDLLKSRVAIQLFGHLHSLRVQSEERYLRVVAHAVHPERDAHDWRPAYNCLRIEAPNSSLLRVGLILRKWDPKTTQFCGDDGQRAISSTEYDVAISDETPQPVAEEVASVEKEIPVDLSQRVRRAAYRYFQMPYLKRIQLAQSLGLLDDADEDVSDPEKFKRVVARVIERNMIETFEMALTK